jgi:hypothetical protein
VTGAAQSVGFAFNLQSANPAGSGSGGSGGNARICSELVSYFAGYGTNSQAFGLGINANQQLVLFSGDPSGNNASAVIATASPIIPVGGWHFAELNFTFGGTCNVWLDGVEVITGSAVPSATPTTLAFHLARGGSQGPAGFTVSFDDVFAKSDATHVGEIKVQTLVPTANSSPLQWTPLSGQNYANAAELPVDGDTSYNYAATAPLQDTYQHAALSGSPLTIPAVQVRACLRKDDSASRTAQTILVSGGTTEGGATAPVSGSYQYVRDIYATDPNTSAAWTPAAVSASLIGVKTLS